MRHHDSDPHDALNDYLDLLAGAPPPGSRAGDLDPELRDDVDRFFDFAERPDMVPEQPRRPDMNATLPASTALASSNRNPRRGVGMPAWTQHLHLVSTGLLIVAVVALTFAVFSNGSLNGGNDGTGDGPNLNGAVPLATVPDDAHGASVAYPGPEECTVEPMTRDEIVAHLQEANVATAPQHERYEHSIEPSTEEADAIIQTFREWQACGLHTSETGPAYQLQLQSPWFSANQLPVFFDYGLGVVQRPIGEDEIEAYADALLSDDPADDANTNEAPVYGTPPELHHEIATPDVIPLPDGATPIVFEGGRSFPMVFAEDIGITGPDTAYAQVYFVDEKTGAVSPGLVLNFGFVKVDGQWVINTYREGLGG